MPKYLNPVRDSEDRDKLKKESISNRVNVKMNKGFTLAPKNFGVDSQSERGFTLVELLAVISIIAILTAITVPNYRSFQDNLVLHRAAAKLTQDIRGAEEMAMAAKEVGPDGAKIVPTGGYGIYFNQSSKEIILFADCDNNQQFTSGNVCGTPPNKFPEKIEEIELELGTALKTLSPSSPLNITFTPPTPKISITGGGTAAIIISLEGDLSKTKIITTNKAGLISVQ